MAEYEIFFKESVWKDIKKFLKAILKKSWPGLKSLRVTHAHWDLKSSRARSSTVSDREITESYIQFRIINLPFG